MKIFYSYGEYINNNPFVDVPEFTGKCFWEDIKDLEYLIRRVWKNRSSLFYSHVYDHHGSLIGIFEYDIDYGKNRINGLQLKLPDDKYYAIALDQAGDVDVFLYNAQGKELLLTDSKK